MTLALLLRRVLCRLCGRGPGRFLPFDRIVENKLRDATRGGLPSAPSEGVVARVAPDSFCFPPIDFPVDSRYPAVGLVPSPRRELWLLAAGAVAGHSGLVYEPRSRTAVLETMLDWHEPPARHPLLFAPRFPAPRPLAGLSLSLVTLSAEGFWHFLVEALPKLHLAASSPAPFDQLLVNGPDTGWKRRWLARAGVSPERLVWIDGHSHFVCERLLFTPPLVADCLPTPWAIAALRALLRVPSPSPRPTRRVWAARSDAPSRRPAWENDLRSRLPGWEFVEFSRLSPGETIALLADTAVLAGPHGANLANAVFLPPGAHLVEVVPPVPAKPLFHRLAAAAALRFTLLPADFATPVGLDLVVSGLPAASPVPA